MEYKDKIIEAFKNFSKKTEEFTENSGLKDIYGKGADKAKNLSNIAKLTLKYNSLSEELNKAYTELGKIVYEERSKEPSGIYEVLFEKIEKINNEMVQAQNQIKEIRSSTNSNSENNNANFEDVVSSTEAGDKKE